MARQTSLCGSESCDKRQDEENKNNAAEMRFLKAAKRCIRKDRARNERIGDDLQIYSIKDNLDETRKLERTICKNEGG
jgi:hypothetical protein